MKNRLLSLLCLLPLWVSSPAWALFDAQVFTGSRTTDFKTTGSAAESLKGSELKAAFHIDPIPLVPVGFGLSLAQTNWDDASKLGYGIYHFKNVQGTDVNLEIQAWLPIPGFGLVPYGKLGYTLAGAYTATFDTTGDPTLALSPSGSFIALGLRYEFLMRFGVIAEYEKASRKLGFDKIKDLPDTSTKLSLDANSSSFLFGIQAGI